MKFLPLATIRSAVNGLITRSESSEVSTSQGWLTNALGGGRTTSGKQVNPTVAMQITAVLACVQVLSQDVAKLPLRIYHERDRKPATDHPLYRLLHYRPNSWQTRYEFRQMLMAHLLLRGNSYALKRFDDRGRLSELIPIPAGGVTLYEGAEGELFYAVGVPSNFYRAKLDGIRTDHGLMIPQEYMVHHRGLTLDGINGISVIGYAREALGMALATEEHGARLFSQGTMLSGVLTHPGKLKDEVAERLKRRWQDMYSGIGNAFKTAVLEEGMKWEPLGMNAEDSQFLQARKFQVNEICRIFRVPPHKVMDLDKATFSNIEHQSQDYTADSLMPWLESLEAGYERHLLPEADQGRFYIEHDLQRLLRADAAGRSALYANGRQWGWLSPNEIRARENMSPLKEGGDQYLQPVNMVPLGTPPSPPKNSGST